MSMRANGVSLRPETAGDAEEIYDLTRKAFDGKSYSDGTEQTLLGILRDLGALTLSTVAEKSAAIIGHIAFSPATTLVGTAGWYALGPISVDPVWQRQGIGSLLIRDGLARLRGLGAMGCILVGDPDYYVRHGFVRRPDLAPRREPPEYFMIVPIGGEPPDCSFEFHPAFYETVRKP